MDSKNIEGAFNNQLLDSIFRTSKKTIQEYVWEIERNNRYKSTRSNVELGTILDDRSRLIDLYEASLQQDAHIRSVIETLESQILGDRYMLAKINEKGKYVKDVEETQKIQGSQFDKMIKGIVESKLYGYTLLEILPDINPLTGKLSHINIVERRNVLPDQKVVLNRVYGSPTGMSHLLSTRTIMCLFHPGISVCFPPPHLLFWLRNLQWPTTSISRIHTASPSFMGKLCRKTMRTENVWLTI